jgi:hypothetical protein
MTNRFTSKLREIGLCLVFASSAFAQENCGFPVSLIRSGFENGEQQQFAVLPIEGTPLSVNITSPVEAEVITQSRVQVYGAITAPANVGVMVNGELAISNATQFSSRPVLLDAGAQTITVTIKNVDGTTVSAVRNVTVNPTAGSDVLLQAASSGGYAPQTIPFRLVTRFPANQTSITRVQIDYQGDGTFDVDSTNANNALSYTFDTPGAYLALARVTFDDGDTQTPVVVRESRYRIQLQSPAYTRQTLCALYYGMKNRLVTNQVPLALNTLAPRIRPSFQSFWTSLGSNLPTIAAALGEVTLGQIADVSAEFIVSVPDPANIGEFLGFPVLFTRGSDGVWRIYGM